MMTFTKLTTIKWAIDQSMVLMFAGFSDARKAYIDEQVAAGLTDGVMEFLDEMTVTRKWVNQESAEAWALFLENLVATYLGTDRKYVEITISDL